MLPERVWEKRRERPEGQEPGAQNPECTGVHEEFEHRATPPSGRAVASHTPSEAGQTARALVGARQALGLAAGAPLAPDEVSVLFKYWLMDALPSPAAFLDDMLGSLEWEAAPDPALAAGLSALRHDSDTYRARLLDSVRDAQHGEPLAPELCLQPQPLPANTLPGHHRHAVIFAASAGFTHEFYPLAVDAYERDARRFGEPRLALLGVHADWLDPTGRVRRAMFLDPERNRLVEADWDVPFRPDSVQFLCLGADEQSLHRSLARRFTCPQLNPCEPSALADDKAATLAGWAALGLEVPRSRMVEAGHREAGRNFLRTCGEVVLKPNRGTEGRDVVFLDGHGPDAHARGFAALEAYGRGGAWLIQERRDGVLFRCPETGGLHTLALRLNGVFDGQRHRAASGYAQIGAAADRPASRGRGGQIRPLAEVLAHLVRRDRPTVAVTGPDVNAWAAIIRQSEQAAGFFEGLSLVGMDVLLDFDATGRLRPVFLEANPRPAGLCHARLWDRLPSRTDEPGVGAALWDGLEAVCKAHFPQAVSEIA